MYVHDTVPLLSVPDIFIRDDADAFHGKVSGRGMDATAPQAPFYDMNQSFPGDGAGYALCFESRRG